MGYGDERRRVTESILEYAGRDGQVYGNTGGGWQHYMPGTGWTNAKHPGDSGLEHERAGRINGNWRSSAARCGGFHGGLGGMRPMGGGLRRR